MIAYDLTGQRYGRLIAINSTDEKKGGSIVWKCLCDCGNLTVVPVSGLRSGNTRSCGCLNKETSVNNLNPTTHGMSKTKIYKVWVDMLNRCRSKNSKDYERYGGRGITVCKRWLRFESFYKDMGDRPEGLTIERKNNNGNYELSNCKWATQKEQCNNKRNNRIIKYNNEILNVTQWTKRLNISQAAFQYRLKNWTIEEAITTPVQHHTAKKICHNIKKRISTTHSA